MAAHETPNKNTLQKISPLIIGLVLRGGVLLSSVFLLLGLGLFFLHPMHPTSHTLLLFPRTLQQLWHGLLMFDTQAFITLGLFILLATPVVRVASSIILFFAEKDWRFCIITLAVFTILLVSIFSLGSLLGQQHSFEIVQFSSIQMVFLFLCAIVAGLLGSLVGLGGGILIVPVLTLLFHFPLFLGIGASIISVIATSSGAASSYVKEHITNMRVGMFLEIATTIGAICGAFLAGLLSQSILSVTFGIILLFSAAPLLFRIGEELPIGVSNDRLATYLHLNSTYIDAHLQQTIPYNVTRTWLGLMMMYVAGLISGLLGIGSGTFKVLALDTAMRLPMKVSTTTSNFMIGVTAAASVGIYFSRGDIVPLVAAPIALGTLIGAMLGTRVLHHVSNKVLRIFFLVVIVISALEMVLHGFGH